jgi:uncharacterized repeat protein (TIGR03803 family)
MQSKSPVVLLVASFTLIFGFLATALPLTAASKVKILHSFGKGKDGKFPYASLILDAAGNLYGTTLDGGDFATSCGGYGCGTVFELTPDRNGRWKEKILHSFGNGNDGKYPYASLILDAAGNLYGTTFYGGASGTGCNGDGCGTVFELTPHSQGTWTEKILYNFCAAEYCADGAEPRANLIFDSAGNLYGTTEDGGASGFEDCDAFGDPCGTVFELKPGAHGKWTEKVLHSFSGGDGNVPQAGLTFDSAGSLYGTTVNGGTAPTCYEVISCGVVFELTPGTGGQWTYYLLYSFQGNTCDDGRALDVGPDAHQMRTDRSSRGPGNGADGAFPEGVVVFDAAGNLYSTTSSGGVACDGTVFRLTPKPSGEWKETVLRSFDGADGNWPLAGLIIDAAGNLYGTTFYGDEFVTTCNKDGCGTVFELTANRSGKWKEKVLYSFTGGTDGQFPAASLTLDAAGNLYGTTSHGGVNGVGTVFEVTP